MIYGLNKMNIKKRECEKAVKTWVPVNIKTSIFNLQYLSYFCMDFHATKTSRSAVKDLSNEI